MSDAQHEVFETNSIIRASAGTGKTYALATRFIRLMLVDGVRPETIVALTFSRAAAQEIYTKILDRLCKAASSGMDERTGKSFAAMEWDALLEDYRNGTVADSLRKLAAIQANPPPHGKDDFAKLLRKLVDTQHLGAIATLDSFILKIVRNFPKEMGVQSAVSVLDPIDEDAAVDEAVKGALSRTDGAAKKVAEAFIQSQKGEYAWQCLGAISNILAKQGWRRFVMAHPECVKVGSRWTVAHMAARLGVDLNSTCPDLSVIPFNDMGRKNAISPEEAFVALARNYDGTRGPLDTTDGVRALMQFFWANPDATSYDYKYYKNFRLNCGTEGAAAIRGAIRHMMNVYLKRQLEVVEAKIRLVEAVECEYERMTRRMGKLTFADFTAYSAEEEFSKRGIALKNVEFRFDSKFDHWALDEFQDTSELQWRCLRELVKSAAEAGYESGNRTAMAVGDMKQSIYTWRGASAQPFEDIASWRVFAGLERDFSESHRYGPNIANFINRVFGSDNIKVGNEIRPVCANAVAAWQEGWREHFSREASDYVKVIAATRAESGEEDGEILPALYAEIKPFWDRHVSEKSDDAVGILVRSNADGIKVAEYLRKKGMLDVVWEGMSPCGDDPVIQAVLALLKLAEHPSDSAIWKMVSELLDVRSILLPDCTSSALASAGVARLLTQQGLSRTLKDWCDALRAHRRIHPDGLTNAKLCHLVALAVAFEKRTSGDGSMLAFADFVAKSGKREMAVSSDVIRVLTIHRSKGLGIDHVFVPLFEGMRSKSAMDVPKGNTPLYDGDAWVLTHLERGSEQFNAKTKAAYEKMCNDRFAESLRTYYVALTRAKKSMVVIIPDMEPERSSRHPNAKPDAVVIQGLLMCDLIRSAVGGVLPYEVGTRPLPKSKADENGGGGNVHKAWPADGAHVLVCRRTPSHGAWRSHGGRNAAEFFDVGFGEATQKGVSAHAAYAAIEWIDPDRSSRAGLTELEQMILCSDFRTAFVKPTHDATVWREKSYELFTAQPATWESGQFDRVVFSGDAQNRSAVIYDFKTNARCVDESVEAFAERMIGIYEAQMNSYRRALCRLTKIPLCRIGMRLLLEATGQSVAIPAAP